MKLITWLAASMVCPGGHGRIATRPKKGNPPRPGIWRQSRARSQARQARRSSRTPQRSNVHHEAWVLGVRWAARGRRSRASPSLTSAKAREARPETCPKACCLHGLPSWTSPHSDPTQEGQSTTARNMEAEQSEEPGSTSPPLVSDATAIECTP